jgi:hypothetical protein
MELDPSQVIKYVRDKNRQIQNEKSINQHQHYPSTNNNMPLNTLNPRQPKINSSTNNTNMSLRASPSSAMLYMNGSAGFNNNNNNMNNNRGNMMNPNPQSPSHPSPKYYSAVNPNSVEPINHTSYQKHAQQPPQPPAAVPPPSSQPSLHHPNKQQQSSHYNNNNNSQMISPPQRHATHPPPPPPPPPPSNNSNSKYSPNEYYQYYYYHLLMNKTTGTTNPTTNNNNNGPSFSSWSASSSNSSINNSPNAINRSNSVKSITSDSGISAASSSSPSSSNNSNTPLNNSLNTSPDMLLMMNNISNQNNQINYVKKRKLSLNPSSSEDFLAPPLPPPPPPPRPSSHNIMMNQNTTGGATNNNNSHQFCDKECFNNSNISKPPPNWSHHPNHNGLMNNKGNNCSCHECMLMQQQQQQQQPQYSISPKPNLLNQMNLNKQQKMPAKASPMLPQPPLQPQHQLLHHPHFNRNMCNCAMCKQQQQQQMQYMNKSHHQHHHSQAMNGHFLPPPPPSSSASPSSSSPSSSSASTSSPPNSSSQQPIIPKITKNKFIISPNSSFTPVSNNSNGLSSIPPQQKLPQVPPTATQQPCNCIDCIKASMLNKQQQQQNGMVNMMNYAAQPPQQIPQQSLHRDFVPSSIPPSNPANLKLMQNQMFNHNNNKNKMVPQISSPPPHQTPQNIKQQQSVNYPGLTKKLPPPPPPPLSVNYGGPGPQNGTVVDQAAIAEFLQSKQYKNYLQQQSNNKKQKIDHNHQNMTKNTVKPAPKATTTATTSTTTQENGLSEEIELGEVVNIEKIKNNNHNCSSSSITSLTPSPSPIDAAAETSTITVRISNKLLPIVSSRVCDWLEKCVEFSINSALKRNLSMKKTYELLLRGAWPRLLLFFMIENNFDFCVTKTVHNTQQSSGSAALSSDDDKLSIDDATSSGSKNVNASSSSSSLSYSPTEMEVAQIKALISAGVIMPDSDEIKEVILFKEGIEEDHENGLDAENASRFKSAYLNALKRLQYMIEAMSSSSQNSSEFNVDEAIMNDHQKRKQDEIKNAYSRLTQFLLGVYDIKLETIEVLFCRNLVQNFRNVHELMNKKFNDLMSSSSSYSSSSSSPSSSSARLESLLSSNSDEKTEIMNDEKVADESMNQEEEIVKMDEPEKDGHENLFEELSS